MLEIIKVSITQAQFVERVQNLCPGKFSAPALRIIFDHLEEKKALFSEAEVHLPDLCKDFTFQESTPSQCSSAVRQLLKASPAADKDTVIEVLHQDLGESLIGVTPAGTVVWWNG